MVLKRFLCIGVQGMLRSSQKTKISAFYHKMAKSIGAEKAQVAAARKLARAIWPMLKNGTPYQDQDEELTEREGKRMVKRAEGAPSFVTPDDLEVLANKLIDKTKTLERLAREVTDAG